MRRVLFHVFNCVVFTLHIMGGYLNTFLKTTPPKMTLQVPRWHMEKPAKSHSAVLLKHNTLPHPFVHPSVILTTPHYCNLRLEQGNVYPAATLLQRHRIETDKVSVLWETWPYPFCKHPSFAFNHQVLYGKRLCQHFVRARSTAFSLRISDRLANTKLINQYANSFRLRPKTETQAKAKCLPVSTSRTSLTTQQRRLLRMLLHVW